MDKLNEYIEKYRKLHTKEENFLQLYPYKDQKPEERNVGDDVMSGYQGKKKFNRYVKIVSEKKGYPISVLDYGCGRPLGTWRYFKSNQMLIRTWSSYDPAVPGFDIRPIGKFDFIICADVVEHIPEEALEWVLDDMRSYLEDDGVIAIATTGDKAHKAFLDGENLHCTMKSLDEWRSILSAKFKNIIFIYTSESDDGTGRKREVRALYGPFFK